MSSLLIDGNALMREFSVKKCHCVSFSRTGALIAAVHQGTTILIFATYGPTTDWRHRLSDHMGRVTSMCWSPDDRILATCSAVGAIYLFRFDGVNA